MTSSPPQSEFFGPSPSRRILKNRSVSKENVIITSGVIGRKIGTGTKSTDTGTAAAATNEQIGCEAAPDSAQSFIKQYRFLILEWPWAMNTAQSGLINIISVITAQKLRCSGN